VSTVAAVRLWGTTIGAVSLEDGSDVAVFQYEPSFARGGVEVAPLMMGLREAPYSFPALRRETFRGLPGMLADSLPDRYGNALIDAWLDSQGRSPDSFNSVERLCYTGSRGMGALEYAPARGPRRTASVEIQIDALAQLAAEVLSRRDGLRASLAAGERERAMRDILSVGTSAGGARAKAVIAFNPRTGEVRSGQVDASPGFEHWLLKFDGVGAGAEDELQETQGYGAIELAYARMAGAAGVAVAECRLLEEGGRRHFMSRRFDRTPDGGKLHMQSLGAIAHYDFNDAGAHSYEQALLTIRRLGLGIEAVEEQYRRMAFNIVARNQDDHVKNIAFLMDRSGRWSLSPAFDMTYSYRPDGAWTSTHQMSLNGRRDGFTLADFTACASSASMKRGRGETILAEVTAAVARWPEFAAAAGVGEEQTARIAAAQRLSIAARSG